MTPMVDPAEKTQPAEGGRDEAGSAPGFVPGPGTHVEGVASGGTADDRTTESGETAERG
jgi:hypothetical protein